MKHYIFLDYGFSSSSIKKLEYIKEAGFDGVFLFYNDNIEDNVLFAKKYKLDIQTVHLPFKGCNVLWEEGSSGDEYVDDMLIRIDKVSKLKINTVIVHTSSGYNPPKISEVGLKRIEKMLKFCEERKVFFAIENIRILEYIDIVFEKMSSPYLKFCFDSGHALAYSKNILCFPWNKYKDYLFCLHLHDNDGENDLHEIPFTDKLDWKLLVKDLKEINYNKDLTLEILNRNTINIDNEENEKAFVKKCFEASIRLEELFKDE